MISCGGDGNVAKRGYEKKYLTNLNPYETAKRMLNSKFEIDKYTQLFPVKNSEGI